MHFCVHVREQSQRENDETAYGCNLSSTLIGIFLPFPPSFLSFFFAIPLMTTYFIRRFIYQLYIQSSCLATSFAMRMQQSSETILLTVLKYLVRILISPAFRIPSRTARDYTHHRRYTDTHTHTHLYIHNIFLNRVPFFRAHVANVAASVPSRQERLSGKRINVRKVSKI